MMLRLPLVSVTPIVVLLQVLGNHLATSAEPRTDTALPVLLATRGKLPSTTTDQRTVEGKPPRPLTVE